MGSFFWADDIAIISESKEGLQNSLDNLQSYCQSNKIRVNVKKTKCMVFNKGGKLLRGNNFHFGNEEIELVNRFNYLGYLLTPSFSIKDLLSDLYKRGLKAYFKMKSTLGSHFKRDIPLTLKLFDALVKPILMYGSDFWGPLVYRQIDNNPIENLNVKLCKHLLGVNKHTSNAGCRAELGRQPLLLTGAKSFIKNWIRIIDGESNIIFKNAFKVNRNSQLQWASKLKDILQRHGLGYIWEHQFTSEQTRPLKNYLNTIIMRLRDSYIQTTLSHIRSQPKLRTYCLLKNDFLMEHYLLNIRNIKTRVAVSKFRLSDHRLAIETGRYVRPKIDPKDRICPVCKVTQDEIHCLVTCQINETSRAVLFDEIIKTKPTFMFMNSKDKFVYLLQNRTELSSQIYKLIESSLLASYDFINKTLTDPS